VTNKNNNNKQEIITAMALFAILILSPTLAFAQDGKTPDAVKAIHESNKHRDDNIPCRCVPKNTDNSNGNDNGNKDTAPDSADLSPTDKARLSHDNTCVIPDAGRCSQAHKVNNNNDINTINGLFQGSKRFGDQSNILDSIPVIQPLFNATNANATTTSNATGITNSSSSACIIFCS
jgi:hypothetical protein